MSAAVVAALCVAAALLWGPVAAGVRTRTRLASAPRSDAVARRRLPADRPAHALTVDLLAAAVAAGVPFAAALEAAAAASPADADSCRRAASALRLGADPVLAVGAEAGLQEVARILARASAHGAAVARLLEQHAAALRVEESFAAAERARRAGVHVVAPLAVCFLPAFVLLAVVPVVLGLGATLLER